VLDATVFLSDGTLNASSGLTRGVDAVSYVFIHDTIMNEYITSESIGARTEWVVNFPTKHFYVYDPSAAGLAPIAPFTTEWIGSGEVLDPNLVLPCEVVVLGAVDETDGTVLDRGIWDREERTPGDTPGVPIPPIVSPAPPPDPDVPIIPFELCYEVNVIRFGDAAETEADGFATEIFGSSNWHNIDNEALGFANGWVKLSLDNYPHDLNLDGAIDPAEATLSRDPIGLVVGNLEGLPVTGFSANAFVNSFLGDGADVLANYGGLFNHKGTRKVGVASSAPVQ
jgi:hypothetical protein